jgi:hypothetical protein
MHGANLVAKLLKSESFDDGSAALDVLPNTPIISEVDMTIDPEAILDAQTSATPIYFEVEEEVIYAKEKLIDPALNKCGLCNDKLISYYGMTFCGICSPDCPLLK